MQPSKKESICDNRDKSQQRSRAVSRLLLSSHQWSKSYPQHGFAAHTLYPNPLTAYNSLSTKTNMRDAKTMPNRKRSMQGSKNAAVDAMKVVRMASKC